MRPLLSLLMFALLLMVGTGPARADDDAPFGLRWGAGIAEIRTKGVEGPETADAPNLKTIAAPKFPGQPEATEITRLTFEQSSGLQRVLWISRSFTDDAAGEKGIALYHRMQAMLNETYGDPKAADEEIAPDASRQTANFWDCLSRDGCAVFVTVWRTPDTDVKMRLVGTPKGEGWLEVLFFGPDWSDIIEQRRKQKH